MSSSNLIKIPGPIVVGKSSSAVAERGYRDLNGVVVRFAYQGLVTKNG